MPAAQRLVPGIGCGHHAELQVGLISAIHLDRLRLPLDPPFTAAWDPQPRREVAAVVVRVETNEGVVGIGSGDTVAGLAGRERRRAGCGSGRRR
jgi:hypothetical protein